MTAEEIEYRAKLAIKATIFDEELDINGEYRNERFAQLLFLEMYRTTPYIYSLGTDKYWSKDINENKKFIDIINKDATLNYTKMEYKETLNNIIEAYPECFVYRINNFCIIFTSEFMINDGVVYSTKVNKDDKLSKCIVPKVPKENHIQWVCMANGEIYPREISIKKIDNALDNYNDDLPDKKINEILDKKESSIIILNGIPGCGKTYYIRNLVNENPKKQFYWLDPSMFSQITSLNFIQFLAENKDGIFILEDCETLLKSRDSEQNGLLSSLLNISDGMLGDALNLKFICTFNTELSNIDKALLRKGRLKLRYEFKELAKEKVAKIFEKLKIDPSLAKDMPLCDVYNFTEDNGNVEKKKIGF